MTRFIMSALLVLAVCCGAPKTGLCDQWKPFEHRYEYKLEDVLQANKFGARLPVTTCVTALTFDKFAKFLPAGQADGLVTQNYKAELQWRQFNAVSGFGQWTTGTADAFLLQ